MIKVGVVYSGARSFGGIEVYLERFFEEYDRERILPRMFALGDWELTDRIASLGEKLTVLSSHRIRPRTIAELADKLVSADYDVVVTQGAVANFYGRLAGRRAHKPVVTIVHAESASDYPNPLSRAAFSIVDRLTRSATTRFVAVSRFLKERLVRSGVPADAVAVVRTGVSPSERIATVRDDIASDPRIATVGRLQPVKNQAHLIEAFGSLSGEGKSLHIWGTGPLRQALARVAFRNGVHDRVLLGGYRADVFADPDEMDIYIQPSHSEGFGTSVIEAMAAGIPTVVTPTGALPELVEDGESGVIARGTGPIDLKVALERLIDDPELRRRCAEGGRSRVVEEFSIDRWMGELTDVLEKAALRRRF